MQVLFVRLFITVTGRCKMGTGTVGGDLEDEEAEQEIIDDR